MVENPKPKKSKIRSEIEDNAATIQDAEVRVVPEVGPTASDEEWVGFLPHEGHTFIRDLRNANRA